MTDPTTTDTAHRPGGRTARIRAQVLDAMRAELAEGGHEGLTMEGVAIVQECTAPPSTGAGATWADCSSTSSPPPPKPLATAGHGLLARRPDGPQPRDPGIPSHTTVIRSRVDGRLVPTPSRQPKHRRSCGRTGTPSARASSNVPTSAVNSQHGTQTPEAYLSPPRPPSTTSW